MSEDGDKLNILNYHALYIEGGQKDSAQIDMSLGVFDVKFGFSGV